jgi:hypothetical protein
VADPTVLDGLIAQLHDLATLTAVERARRIPDLIRTCQITLGRERGRAMAEATDPTGQNYLTQVQLAGLLGIHRNKVADSIGAWRRSVT